MEDKRILYVSSEVVPYLAENEVSLMSYDVPKMVNDQGGQIRIFMPRYGNINERRHQLHEVIRLSGMNLVVNDLDMPLIIKVASIPKERIQVYEGDVIAINGGGITKSFTVRKMSSGVGVERILKQFSTESNPSIVKGVLLTLSKETFAQGKAFITSCFNHHDYAVRESALKAFLSLEAEPSEIRKCCEILSDDNSSIISTIAKEKIQSILN